MSELATLSIDGAVATLTFNRPEARNAMSLELLDASLARMAELEQTGASVLVVTGAGRSFCAGMDLKSVIDDPDAPPRLLNRIADLGLALRNAKQVTVARVNGAAIGGGCGLACACDLAVTHNDSKMGFPEVDMGVCPAVVAPMLVRKIGAGRARAMLLSGGTFTGAHALEVGLVDYAAESAGGLDGLCDEVVGRLATGGPAALAATKGLLNTLDGSADESVARRAAELSASVIAAPGARERLRAVFGAKG